MNAALTGHEMAEIRALIEARSGILFDDSRERFFSTRVREHLERKQLGGTAELVRLLRSSNVEYDAFLEGLLTQETTFFRYPAVYEALETRVLPEIRTRKFWHDPRTLRIWSAGCSSGEEPYSIALTIAQTLPFAEAWDIRLWATDISKRALEFAERGVYSRRSLANVDMGRRENYFTKVGEQFQVKARFRNMISFAPLNLAQPVYMGRFDCIFCMNVLIYFSEARRAQLIQRFHDSLEPGGYLFLGHAEFISRASVKLETIVHRDCRIYRKPIDPPARAAAVTEARE